MRVTADPVTLAAASHLVLPGVGAFADCRQGLHAVPGVVDALRQHIAAGKPFLGICVGMQLMATRGLEHGETAGFDWIAGDVEALTPAPLADGRARKIPIWAGTNWAISPATTRSSPIWGRPPMYISCMAFTLRR